MTSFQFKHIFGPVYSWRMGMSLGIDPLSTEQKYCNFNCAYCQLGSSQQLFLDRKEFVSVEAILEELQALPDDQRVDYYTFSGNGEPTLAANLGEMVRAVKDQHRGSKVAVITNSSTIMRSDVQQDLLLADLVLFKLEAVDQDMFERMDRPVSGILLKDIIAAIKAFKLIFKGKLALQIMFTEMNKGQAEKLAALAAEIAPDEVQLNTPLRPSPVKPLTNEDMALIKDCFKGPNVVSVYEEEKRAYQPFNDGATEKRHGKFKERS